jgi:hypothetical protein
LISAFVGLSGFYGTYLISLGISSKLSSSAII